MLGPCEAKRHKARGNSAGKRNWTGEQSDPAPKGRGTGCAESDWRRRVADTGSVLCPPLSDNLKRKLL